MTHAAYIVPPPLLLGPHRHRDLLLGLDRDPDLVPLPPLLWLPLLFFDLLNLLLLAPKTTLYLCLELNQLRPEELLLRRLLSLLAEAWVTAEERLTAPDSSMKTSRLDACRKESCLRIQRSPPRTLRCITVDRHHIHFSGSGRV